MPVYHFDSECGDTRYHDPDGIELGSIDEARQQLAALMRDLTHRDVPEVFHYTVSAQVRCGDRIVLQGSCSLSVTRPAVWSPTL
jgi:hypothetical protein